MHISGFRASGPLRKGKISEEIRDPWVYASPVVPQGSEATQCRDKKREILYHSMPSAMTCVMTFKGLCSQHHVSIYLVSRKRLPPLQLIVYWYTSAVHPPKTRRSFIKLEAASCRDEGDCLKRASGSRTTGLKALSRHTTTVPGILLYELRKSEETSMTSFHVIRSQASTDYY